MQNRCGRTQKLNRTLVARTNLCRVGILVCPHALSQSFVETPRQINCLSAPRGSKHQVFPVGKFRQPRPPKIQKLPTICPLNSEADAHMATACEAEPAVATPPLPLEDNFKFLHRLKSRAAEMSLRNSKFECQIIRPPGRARQIQSE